VLHEREPLVRTLTGNKKEDDSPIKKGVHFDNPVVILERKLERGDARNTEKARLMARYSRNGNIIT